MSTALIDSGTVLLDLHDDGVAHLRLNRPEASNGLDVPFLQSLYTALMAAHGEPRLRAMLVTGEGPHFCAGGDVKTFASKGEALPDYLREATQGLQICASALMRLQAPVVAAVHGFAAGGGGFGLVCAADLVIAGESAKFLLGATRVGMAPDAGGSVTLTQLVGLRKAMEIALTNPTISAAEALEMGLITRVVADDAVQAEGLALAQSLAAGATLALAATKRLIWDGLGAVVEARLPEEARTVSELSGTYDSREGLAAVIERRRPVFEGR
jgi:2-(1,2-epoxy-1,2-dihydrophenyl)acetyl-CoA isomerase